MSKQEEQQILDQALAAGVQHIKQHYDADFVMNSYEIEDSANRSRVFLYGYVKGHEEESITISYSFMQHEIVNVTGPEWFIDSRLPEDTSVN
ncbi:hypothetical protein [Paenibacillus massiliensis]|uniref:hypothetical protein n=1 Tax=Paenibacillus massiliensis TaxID=225917 RepID=UPI00041BC5D8|nr:hypothetical protein [Paenibacillus massiliensis]